MVTTCYSLSVLYIVILCTRPVPTEPFNRVYFIEQIQTLHLMTARLVPAFVDTFNDDHISVKLQAIAVRGGGGERVCMCVCIMSSLPLRLLNR